MLKTQLEEFKRYSEEFNKNDENIMRKYNHSIRAMNFAIEIAKSMNYDEKTIEIVGLAGLLHDIGRFEQWTLYNTYSDTKSIDHAMLGVEVLKRNEYINNYIQDKESQDIILTAILEHNKYKISEGMEFKREIISKIVRDADKLDLLETQCNAIKDNSILNKEIVENIYNQKCCINNHLENDADKIIRQLCFMYDINFRYSFTYIKEKGIINKKIQVLKNNCPKDINIIEIEKILNDYVDKNI